MKLKKILAVALAATTALSSGVAYDMLGAGAGTAEAAENGFFSENDTFTITNPDGVKLTFTVTNPILNAAAVAQSATAYGTNGSYTNAELNETFSYKGADISLTTAGAVKLTAIEGPNTWSTATGLQDVKIPMSIGGVGSGAGDDQLEGTGNVINSTAAVNTATGRRVVTNDNNGIFYVTAIELNGDSVSNADKVGSLSITTGNATALKSIKAENFNHLNQIGYENGATSEAFTLAETIDISGSDFSLANAAKLYAGSTKIETLDISDLNQTSKSQVAGNFDFSAYKSTLKTVNIAGNAYIEDVNFETSKTDASLNITDCTGIKDFTVKGAATDSYDNPAQKGVKFITDGGDGGYELDMSFVVAANDVTINGAGLRSFTAPTIALNNNNASYTIDVKNNALETVNLSSASNALSVDVSNNKLMDIDVSGLSSATSLNVSGNYLTSLDVSSVNSGKSFGLVADKNFIPTGDNGNFSRSDDQKSVNVTNQRSADAFKWAYAGDMAQASGSTSKGLIKLGGSGTLVGGIVVVGAPDGFAAKLAETIKWTEANSSETSAITLGESAVVQAGEMAYNMAWPGQGNLAAVIVSTAVTGNATKTAAEKVTLQYGNTKQDINISNDNIIIVDYDITGGLPTENAENIKNSNKYTVNFANLMFPREGFILSSAGTVDAVMSSVVPLAEVSSSKVAAASVLVGGNEDKFGDLIEEKLKVMEGVTFSKWNTATDGTGTPVAKNAKLKALTEDTTVYAQYTENTYGINYNKVANSKVTVTGSTASQTGVKFGENVTLNSNGFTTTKGNYYGWRGGEVDAAAEGATGVKGQQFYSDGESVQGIAAKNKKSDTFKMNAYYGDADHYIDTSVSSLDLIVGDADKGAYALGDLKAKVTGDPTEGNKDAQVGVDLGLKAAKYTYISSNNDVVKITTDNKFAIAQGSGTANIYVRDDIYGNMATVSVTVQGKAEAAAAAEEAAKIAAANKAIDAGETTDVSDYSTYAAKVKKNADGENTVTVVEGKDKKTVKISTITIGDKVYTVTRIGAGAYKGSKKLTTLATGNNVKVIGKTAFANCSKLKKATLGTKVAKIMAKAFANDKKLATVVVNSKKLTTTKKVATTAFKNAGKSVKTTVKIKKSISAKIAKKEKKVFTKAGLKKYGKKTCTYKRGTKKI